MELQQRSSLWRGVIHLNWMRLQSRLACIAFKRGDSVGPLFGKYLWGTCSRQTFRENCRGGGEPALAKQVLVTWHACRIGRRIFSSAIYVTALCGWAHVAHAMGGQATHGGKEGVGRDCAMMQPHQHSRLNCRAIGWACHTASTAVQNGGVIVML